MSNQFQPAGVMPTPAPVMNPTPAPVSYEATRQPDYNELMAYYNASQANQEVRVQPSVHSATQNASQPQPHEIVQQHVEPSIDFSDASCTSITLKLDGESLKILMDANEIFRETIVNMGIKLASQTPIYREFFRFKDLRVNSGSIGGVNTPVGTGIGSVTDVTTVATVSAPVVVPNTVAGSAPAKKKSTGFTTWG